MTDKSNTPVEIKDLWQTPPEIYRALRSEFPFFLDAAASQSNALCTRFIDEKENTLEANWLSKMPIGVGRAYAWLNPPYSAPMPFVKKAAQENADHSVGCVMLLPADTSVQWFKEAIRTAHEVRFITGGRLSFLNASTGKPAEGNPKGSMLIIWHPWPRAGECRMTTVERDELMAYGRKRLEALKCENGKAA
ncbi:phage N-6-adenine-methyltransferase [Cronobacter sakazakii]|nr:MULTISPECIES: phage N-6-adenine-methyltransferase [Cronobacter]ELL7784635.1 phage N-6-adenine-methyltransferase [Cronobacter sakazakii]ELY2483991.1 phage N-6-adenine-methyltransferase [Cronobacter sakazakii]ELY2754056.1 phage N-6-adenine-methyltransferase [Cronobacter sakazakii]ELY2762267.1 phage N-6-adenine-methyltransferase [Cronobacter sakazakii]ELY3986089.1 phage N-6-adenine-methyltransferase [Cronobacter sakazakii]